MTSGKQSREEIMGEEFRYSQVPREYLFPPERGIALKEARESCLCHLSLAYPV